MTNNTLFDKFEIVEFNGKQTRDFIKGYDITNITKKGDFFMDYLIEGNPNLDTLSYEIYGNATYYWTIILVNNIQDAFFDLPLSQEELKEIAKEQLATEAKSLGLTETESNQYLLVNYYSKFTSLEEENNEKRKIKVVKHDMLPKFLTLLEEA